MVIACAALTASLAGMLGATAIVVGDVAGAWARFALTLAAVPVATAAWRYPHSRWPSHALLVTGLCGFTALAWGTPGRDVMPLYWETLLPLMATLLLDRRRGVAYALVTMASIALVLGTRASTTTPQILPTPPALFDALRIVLFSSILGLFVGLFDLDRRRALAVADAARARAEAERAAKARYFSAMSHELRTPLNGVLGMIQVLLSERLDRAERDALELAKRSCEALGALVTDVVADVTTTKAHAEDRRAREARVVSLPELADDVAQLSRAVAARKGLTLAVTVAPELPRRVRVDDVRLRQILHNLIGNAVKFTECGSIQLSLESPPGSVGDAIAVRFVVEDTGIGMPPDVLATVFEPFRQADASTSRRFGGSGLGLAISRQTVAQLGGRLEVRSTPDVGTRFEFTLALTAAPDERASTAQAVVDEALAPRRVLCVDDNAVNLRVLELMLTRAGHAVDRATDGAAAVEAVRANRYDAILMDRHMPVLDGLAATRAIRALDQGRTSVPIIAVTAAAMPDELAACIEAGMDDVLTKPLDRELLIQTLARAWRRQAGAAPTAPTASPAPTPAPEVSPLTEDIGETSFPATLVRALDGLLSPALRTSHALRTPGRVVVLLGLMVGLSNAAFAVMAALAGEQRKVQHQVLLILAIAGLLLTLRRVRRDETIYVGTLFCGAAMATFGIAVSETVLLSELLWTSLLPLYATLVLGLRWAAPATALTLAVYVAGFVLRALVGSAAPSMPPELALVDVARVLGFAVTMAGAAAFFDYSRAQASAEAEAARKRAHEATVARSAFLANMTHELRTPMGGVVGILEILREGATNEDGREHLATAARAGRQLLELVDDILDHARLEHGRLLLERLPHGSAALLRAVVDTAERRVAVHGATLSAALTTPRSPPQAWLLDLPRILRAVAKLVDDLAGTRGAERVRLDAALVLDAHGAGRLDVTLRGQATPAAVRPREPSTQDGAQLGVALARALVAALGGRVEEDAEGWGIQIPLGAASVAPPSPTSNRLPLAARAHPVLVADDAAVNRAVASSLVRRLGLSVVEAHDGLEALERVGGLPLTAALLDHEMPGLDGIECVRRVRADPRHDSLPLVLVTASNEPALAAAALAAGADAVLVKPVSLRDLATLLGEA